MLSRCSSEIAGALSGRYPIPKGALRWFELLSEVDVRHIRISKWRHQRERGNVFCCCHQSDRRWIVST